MIKAVDIQKVEDRKRPSNELRTVEILSVTSSFVGYDMYQTSCQREVLDAHLYKGVLLAFLATHFYDDVIPAW